MLTSVCLGTSSSGFARESLWVEIASQVVMGLNDDLWIFYVCHECGVVVGLSVLSVLILSLHT